MLLYLYLFVFTLSLLYTDMSVSPSCVRTNVSVCSVAVCYNDITHNMELEEDAERLNEDRRDIHSPDSLEDRTD